jgi:hypothetical protein
MFSAAPAFAQVAVLVSSTTKDPVGKRLDFALRDQLRSSKSFQLTYDADAAFIKIALVTLDPNENQSSAGSETIYSFNILLVDPDGGLDRYYTSMVGVCGSSRVQQCGQDLAQEIGVTIEDLRAAFAKASTQKPFDSPP